MANCKVHRPVFHAISLLVFGKSGFTFTFVEDVKGKVCGHFLIVGLHVASPVNYC